jgi:autophagy-related protein 2
VNVVDIKIDYSPKQINLHALQQGDYIQMLNLFSIDGLEITLTKVALTGISGLSAGLNKCLEEWVHEIYAHQIHRY